MPALRTPLAVFHFSAPPVPRALLPAEERPEARPRRRLTRLRPHHHTHNLAADRRSRVGWPTTPPPPLPTVTRPLEPSDPGRVGPCLDRRREGVGGQQRRHEPRGGPGGGGLARRQHTGGVGSGSGRSEQRGRSKARRQACAVGGTYPGRDLEAITAMERERERDGRPARVSVSQSASNYACCIAVVALLRD